MNNYDFPVELQPVYLGGGQEIAKRKAVVRTDTMQTLGIVSDDYGLVKHASVIDAFRKNINQEVKETIKMTNDGAYLFYQLMFPKVETEIRKGDLVRMQMIVKNSYNGANSLQIIFGAFRLVCENGMILGTKFMSFNFRHIGNVGSINDESVVDAFSEYIESFQGKMQLIQGMTKKTLAVDETLFDEESLKLPEYLRKDAFNRFQNDGDHSVWGYYNSLTASVTHSLRVDSPNSQIRYGMEAWKAAQHAME